MHAAVRSGIPDIQVFDAMDDYSKGMLVEYWRIRDKMQAWESQQQEDELAKVKPRG